MQILYKHVSHFKTDAVCRTRAMMTEFYPVELRIFFDFAYLSSSHRLNREFRNAELTITVENLLTGLMDSYYKMRQVRA